MENPRRTGTGVDDAALYKVAYDEAVRALSEQRAAVDALRGRAGLLLSAAAVTTSFLGAEALNGGGAGLVSWVALAAFAAVAVVLLAILRPGHWEFSVDPGELIEGYIEAATPAPLAELHRELSLYMRSGYLENWRSFARLTMLFQAVSALLVFEVILWIIAIAPTP